MSVLSQNSNRLAYVFGFKFPENKFLKTTLSCSENAENETIGMAKKRLNGAHIPDGTIKSNIFLMERYFGPRWLVQLNCSLLVPCMEIPWL